MSEPQVVELGSEECCKRCLKRLSEGEDAFEFPRTDGYYCLRCGEQRDRRRSSGLKGAQTRRDRNPSNLNFNGKVGQWGDNPYCVQHKWYEFWKSAGWLYRKSQRRERRVAEWERNRAQGHPAGSLGEALASMGLIR